MPLCIVAAAGPGLGVAVARRFAREGFDIALIAREAPRLEALAELVRSEGGRATTHTADLCALDTVAAAFADISAIYGSADVLVYNGARWHERPAMTLNPIDFTWDLSLCATGALVCAQHVYPGMREAGSGTILFTGGGLALNPQYGAGLASLTAGKSALRGLTYALAAEFADDGVHVATVTVAGPIAPGTAFGPERIADRYWALHTEPRSAWSVETIYDGIS
jgi:NAD(P)-dependent dehydrogenase (short-subunit alcohol dehydrogenase family)